MIRMRIAQSVARQPRASQGPKSKPAVRPLTPSLAAAALVCHAVAVKLATLALFALLAGLTSQPVQPATPTPDAPRALPRPVDRPPALRDLAGRRARRGADARRARGDGDRRLRRRGAGRQGAGTRSHAGRVHAVARRLPEAPADHARPSAPRGRWPTRYQAVLARAGKAYGIDPRMLVGGVGPRVQLRAVCRRAAHRAGAGDAGVGRPARRLLPPAALRRAHHRRSRRHRAGQAQRILGRRAGPGAVHAVELPGVGRGLRQGRRPRRLGVDARRVRLDRQLPAAARLDAGPVGLRGEDSGRGAREGRLACRCATRAAAPCAR